MAEWKVDLTEWRRLIAWYRKQPQVLRKATAGMLNDFAFGTQRAAIRNLGQKMTVRNQRFVSSRVQVKKTAAVAISMQRAWTGSVAVKRFSGWAEQEIGTPTERKRFATLAGRAGERKKQVRQVARLKPNAEVVSMKTPGFRPSGGEKNLAGFFAMLRRRGENRLIRIGRMLYKRKRNKFELVQKLIKKQPKHLRWLRQGRAQYFAAANLTALWEKHYGRLMGRP